jgi:hypothetical protein
MAKTYDDETDFTCVRRVAQPGTLQPLTSELSWGGNKRCVALNSALVRPDALVLKAEREAAAKPHMTNM